MSQWIAFQIAGDEGPPLIFLHGLHGDAEQWRPQLDAFSDRYRVIAWDMPGYGDSAALANMTMSALTEALGTLLDRLSVNQAHLVGQSIGGLIALSFADWHPDRVLSLTLLATDATMPTNEDRRNSHIEQLLQPFEQGAKPAELAPSIIGRLVGDQSDSAGLERAILGLAALSETGFRHAVDCLSTVDQPGDTNTGGLPTLLVAGGLDPLASADAIEAWAEASPDAQFECFQGCGHLINLERADAFNARLERFLDSLVRH